MRPLHSLLVLVSLLLLGAGGWFLLRTADPEQRVKAAGPAPAMPVESAGAPAAADLRAPDGERSATRVERPVEGLSAPAAEVASASPATSGERLSGRVLDERGAPLAKARVLVAVGNLPFFADMPIDSLLGSSWIKLEEAETDAQGRFVFEGVEPGALKLGCRLAGFAPYDAHNVPRPATAGQELEPIVLTRGAQLSGRVVDAAGRPVAGAAVKRAASAGGGLMLLPSGIAGVSAARTAADGTFLVDILAVGPWTLRFESEEHPGAELSGRTQTAGERVENLLVQLDESGQIGGRVSGELPAGRSFADLRVRARPQRSDADAFGPGFESRRAEIAADGRFELRGLRLGQTYSLSVVVDEGGPDELAFGFGASLSAPVEAETGARSVVLLLSPESALVFSVVDAGTGAPIESFGVQAGVGFAIPQMGPDGRALRARPGGLARVGNLRPRNPGDRATLEIEAVGYEPYELSDIKLIKGQETDLGPIALEPAPVLSVLVLDAASGRPLPDASVTLREIPPPQPASGGRRMGIRMTTGGEDGGDMLEEFGQGRSRQAKTDADGVARLTAFAGSNSQLRVRESEHAPWSSEEFVGAATAEQREVRLVRGGSVVVHLFDAAGEPLAGGRVEHRAGGEGRSSFGSAQPQVTNSAGETTFEHLAPGLQRFRPTQAGGGGFFQSGDTSFAMVMDGGGSDGEPFVEVLVSEGGLHDIELHAPLALVVFGALSEDGEPLVDATLSLVKASAQGGGGPDLSMFGGGGPKASTGGDGSFEFEGVKPGEYNLRIEHPERAMPAEYPVRLVDVDQRLDLDLDVAVLEGRVSDSEGQPLAGIEVWPERARKQGGTQTAVRMVAFAGNGGGSMISLEEGGFSRVRTRTDQDGNYRLRGVQPEVDLEVRSKGASLQPGRSESVRVGADETRTGIDIRMESAGDIEIEAVRADGSPAPNLLITARFEGVGEGIEPKTALLDEFGRTKLEGLAPGSWRISARSVGFGGGEQPSIPDTVVEVRAGASTPAALSAP